MNKGVDNYKRICGVLGGKIDTTIIDNVAIHVSGIDTYYMGKI